MFHYLKTIESIDNISPSWVAFNIIGKIKHIDLYNNEFIFYAEDTDIQFNCIPMKGWNIINEPNTNDGFILNGHYFNNDDLENTLMVGSIKKAPLGLTGSMEKDMLILMDESNSIASVQFQNGYIKVEEYEELQKAWLNYRDKYHEILFFKE